MRVLLFLLFSLITSLSTFSQDFLYVSSHQLNLRDRPSSSSTILGTYPRGTKVEVFSIENGWAVVRINMRLGYMQHQHLVSCIPSSITSLINSNEEEIVYICVSNTAHRYHNKMCPGLGNCTHRIDTVLISEAIFLGKTPCGHCY